MKCVICKEMHYMEVDYTQYEWMHPGNSICNRCQEGVIKKYLSHTATGSVLELIKQNMKLGLILDSLRASVSEHLGEVKKTTNEIIDTIDFVQAENQQLHQMAEDAEQALKEK